MPRQRLQRRTFLRASGVCIGLPLLDAMMPRIARAETAADEMPPKRTLLIGRALGLHAPYFFPSETGRDYEPSRYLKLLESHREDFTVFSGMSHHYGTGHGTLPGLFTGVSPERMRPGDVRNSISLDQELAAKVQSPTRFANLVLGASGLSWNHKGVGIPAQDNAVDVFKQLFIDGTPEEIKRQIQRLQNGRSILDGVREQAKGLTGILGGPDRDRIDLLMTSIRNAERRLQQDQEWVLKPKPKVDDALFKVKHSVSRLIQRENQWLELARLALQTDSTRVISLYLYSHGTVNVNGSVIGHHEASHHGKQASSLKRLATIEEAQLTTFSKFLDAMKGTTEGNRTLLDRTQVLYASDLGNASAHTTSNLPVLLIGGGYRHAGHVAFDRENNTRLSNLLVRMLQQMDIESDRFGSSDGVVSEV